jgi:uncharacterized repeat protein (TIGR03833 family)
VSIVLKVDQPSGNEVQGIVAELLTLGNHPRGIKVRLRDGRVGRVQRIVSQETAEAGSAGLEGLGRNGEVEEEGGRVQVLSGTMAGAGSGGGFTGRRYGDYRVDAPDEPEEAELSLADYVVVKKGKKGKSKKPVEEGLDEDKASENAPAIEVATSTCPVCGEFEGDEAAVAHHVNGHFD